MSNFSLASLKNVAEELRAQVYPKNDTEKKVPSASVLHITGDYVFDLCFAYQVYEAISALTNWGASTTLLSDIAGDTYD
jgi:hypothetical protein